MNDQGNADPETGRISSEYIPSERMVPAYGKKTFANIVNKLKRFHLVLLNTISEKYYSFPTETVFQGVSQ
jgi:hypothetical protein